MCKRIGEQELQLSHKRQHKKSGVHGKQKEKLTLGQHSDKPFYLRSNEIHVTMLWAVYKTMVTAYSEDRVSLILLTITDPAVKGTTQQTLLWHVCNVQLHSTNLISVFTSM